MSYNYGGVIFEEGGYSHTGGGKNRTCLKSSKKGPSGKKRCKKFAPTAGKTAWQQFVHHKKLQHPRMTLPQIAHKYAAEYHRMMGH